MDAIILSVNIGTDRRIVIDLPVNTPLGQAEITIKPHELEVGTEDGSNIPNLAREAARAKLLAAGLLSTIHRAPPGAPRLSDMELQRLGQRLPGSKSLDELIDEGRGSI